MFIDAITDAKKFESKYQNDKKRNDFQYKQIIKKPKKIQLPIFSKELLKKKLDKKNEQIFLEILYRHQKQINEEIKIKMENKK